MNLDYLRGREFKASIPIDMSETKEQRDASSRAYWENAFVVREVARLGLEGAISINEYWCRLERLARRKHEQQ
jgi:hypothetical protein